MFASYSVLGQSYTRHIWSGLSAKRGWYSMEQMRHALGVDVLGRVPNSEYEAAKEVARKMKAKMLEAAKTAHDVTAVRSHFPFDNFWRGSLKVILYTGQEMYAIQDATYPSLAQWTVHSICSIVTDFGRYRLYMQFWICQRLLTWQEGSLQSPLTRYAIPSLSPILFVLPLSYKFSCEPTDRVLSNLIRRHLQSLEIRMLFGGNETHDYHSPRTLCWHISSATST